MRCALSQGVRCCCAVSVKMCMIRPCWCLSPGDGDPVDFHLLDGCTERVMYDTQETSIIWIKVHVGFFKMTLKIIWCIKTLCSTWALSPVRTELYALPTTDTSMYPNPSSNTPVLCFSAEKCPNLFLQMF